MEEMRWCVKIKSGLRLVNPNEEVGKSYLKMAEEFIGTMNREKDKNIRASVSAGYYSIYYSLYSIMQKIGIKCEIHICSIEFMKEFLNKFYPKDYLKLVEVAFEVRKTLQYYVDKSVNKEDIKLVLIKSYEFFVLSREIFSKLKDSDVEKIREEFKELIKKK